MNRKQRDNLPRYARQYIAQLEHEIEKYEAEEKPSEIWTYAYGYSGPNKDGERSYGKKKQYVQATSVNITHGGVHLLASCHPENPDIKLRWGSTDGMSDLGVFMAPVTSHSVTMRNIFYELNSNSHMKRQYEDWQHLQNWQKSST